MTTWGISSPFGLLFHTSGQITNALLTRSPLGDPIEKYEYYFQGSSFDLHVLGTPPTFILSQDQTLRKKNHILRCMFYVIDLNFTCIDWLLITIQLLRCLSERGEFYHPNPTCQGNLETKNRCLFYWHRLVRIFTIPVSDETLFHFIIGLLISERNLVFLTANGIICIP